MYKRVYLVILVCLSNLLSIKAQNYKPMLDHNSEWQITSCTSTCITDVYYTDGDTLDNGVMYTVLNGYHYISRTFWIRENTAEQKVYMSYIDPIRGREEALLYDYSLNVGDTITLVNPVSPFPYNGGTYEVDSIINQPLFDGQNYRVYYFSPYATNPSTEYPIWIESIGTLSIINAPGGAPNVSGVGKLSCYFNDGFLNYSQLDSISGCSPQYVTGIDENILNTIQVLPSYATDQITIESSEQLVYLEVFNSFGQLILNKELQSSNSLDVSNFENGLYFLVISGLGQQKYTQKFIKY